MKRLNKLFLARAAMTLLAVLLGSATGAWAQYNYSGGSGRADDPYLISTVADWIALCNNVNNMSRTYYNEFFKLTADITVEETFSDAPTKMVGISEDVNFRGTFDGNGHTLTVNYTDYNDQDYSAPFRYIRNATIKNLHVAGSITKTKKKNAGGLVGTAFGTCHITNCRSSVEITCAKGDCSSGGFIGELGTSSSADDTYIDNCIFDGKLEGESSYKWGGFIGWVEDEPDAYLTNCLFSPEHVYINSEGDKTFARGDDIHITNCYYTYTLVDGQGATKVRDMDKETLRMRLGEAWEIIGDKVLPIMSSHSFTEGDGSEESPYRIASADDWNKLATNVYLGETYSGKYFLMTKDIGVSRLVGARSGEDTFITFNGTFDGGGHTLTVNYTTDAEFCGPFCFTYGATIKNLITTGTINTSNKHAGGVVGRNGTGRLTLTNVTSNITINSTYSGSAEHGGLVGYTINADIAGCAFTGSLLGENSTDCGGLIGWKSNTVDSSADINGCVFAPASVTVSTTNASTLARISSGGVVNITNCYYSQPLGTVQGKQRYSITAGEHVKVENAGSSSEYDVSDIVSYGVGIKYNDVLYAGEDDEVSLNLSYVWTDAYQPDGFHVSAGTLTGNSNPYTLTMPAEDVLVSTNIPETPWTGEGTADSPYRIEYASHWDLLAERVAVGTDYSGKHFQLDADITVKTMVGIDGQHTFNGTFDGNSHKITLDYDATAEYAAPFRFVNGATIRNLTIDGAINSEEKFAAGFIGQATGAVTIDHCRSSVTINSTVNGDGTNGGFVAVVIDGGTTIRDCLFDGSLLGILTDNNAGFVGWTASSSGGRLTIENGIFAPEEVTMIGDKTFARSYNSYHPNIINCYYTQAFGDEQGNRIFKTEQEVAANGLYYSMTAFDKTYYGKVIVSMQVSFDQTDEEIKPVPTIMTEDGTTIPKEGNYTLAWSGDGKEAGVYTVTITAEANTQFPIPNAQFTGSKTFEYNVVSMHAPKNLTATSTTSRTATISWTGTADSYKVRYRPAELNTVYFTNFENGLPDDWTTIDADGDGYCWEEAGDYASGAHSGASYVYSESFVNEYGAITPDNWLVSPQLPLNGMLKVWMKGQDANDYREHVAIYVSTTGNALADFSDIILPETIVTNEYVEYAFNLSKYAGKKGYIAIRHFNCTNQYRLNVDDFGLYDGNPTSDNWKEMETTETTAVITGLNPDTYYAYQVDGIVNEESYSSSIAVLQTEVEEPEVTQVSVAPQQTTAKVNWEGYGNSFNVRYAVGNGITNTAKVTLSVGEVWDDGTGYQMLLDADANTYGSIIPEGGSLTNSGDASAEVYAEFEYKIPKDADGALTTTNIVRNNESVTIEIPAGTYDWCITNPTPDHMMYIASFDGNIGGRKDNFVFEAGMEYVFTVKLDVANDMVDLQATPLYGEWTQVAVENGNLTTELTGLTKGTTYAVQVQAVLNNGMISEWSPFKTFTTLGEGEIALYDGFDNQEVIEANHLNEANVTLAGRTLFKDGAWNTLCLPFNLDLEGSPLAGAEARTLTEASINESGTTLTLNFSGPVETLVAGTPYIIKWASGSDIANPVFNGITINKTMADVEFDGVLTFKGNYDFQSFDEDNHSILFMGEENTLNWPKSGATIGACRAYFQLADGITAGDVNSARLFFGSQESQGIISIENGKTNIEDETGPWYTLDGVKVEKPKRKGLYIQNGKKVVIK